MVKGRSRRAQPDAVSTAGPAHPAGRSSSLARPAPAVHADPAVHAVTPAPSENQNQTDRLRRRAAFLRDLAEAKELRARVRPRRTRVARLREALRRATYRN